MTKYAYYVDLGICAGCEACTVACQNVNGLDYDMRYTKISRHMQGTYPNVTSMFVVNQCLHCDDPACASVCPTGATYKTSEGPVKVDYDKCIGCKYCMTACPYEARTFDEEANVVRKCSLCYDRMAQGEQPACVQTCLTGARMIGDMENPDDPIHAAIAQDGVVKVEGTSFYFRVPPGFDRNLVPENFQAAGITFAWQSIFQPVGQIMLGGTVGALLVSMAVNAVKSMRKEGAEHGDH